MNDIEKIKNINSYDLTQYSNVSSREKLVAYSIKYMDDNDIATSFNNLCIVTFKLFPEKFFFCEDFKEYPHIEMLNRTLLHLRPKERNYATGGSRENYSLTLLGREIAKQVEYDIKGEAAKEKVKIVMDEHKNNSINEYDKVLKSSEYAQFLKDGIFTEEMIWSYFQVTPFTQKKRILTTLKEVMDYAKRNNDEQCYNFIKLMKDSVRI